MGYGPVPATRKLLDHVGINLEQVGVIEINEAFAAQVLSVTRALELADDEERVNPNGGAIALGHPLGASGARLMTSMLHELERRGGRYALQAICCAGGMGTATLIERL